MKTIKLTEKEHETLIEILHSVGEEIDNNMVEMFEDEDELIEARKILEKIGF